MKNKILEWKTITNSITENWIREYFDLYDDEEISVDWVANDVGSIFEFADMYFNFSDILDCYKYNISRESLFLWYDYCLSNEFVNISLANFILSPQKRKEQEEKELAQLKERLESAKKELKEAIERYNKVKK